MAASRSLLGVTRYRLRLLVLRLRHTRASRLDLLNLTLAVIGAWSVIVAGAQFLPLPGPWAVGGFWAAAVGLFLSLYWFRYTRRPQDIFRLAAQSEGRAQELRTWMAEGMHSTAAFEALERLYAPLVDDVRRVPGFDAVAWPRDGGHDRALVLTIPAPQQQDLDDLLVEAPEPRAPDWRSRVSEFAGERQMYMSTLRRDAFLGNPFGDEEGQNVILDRLGADGRLRAEVARASYGQIVRTSDALINEFSLFGYLLDRSAVRGRPAALRLSGRRALSVLPWRRAVHSWDDGTDLLLAPRGRASGLGVALVLQERRSGEATALLARRSPKVGTYPDVLHVIPSGMLNLRPTESATGSGAVRLLPRLTMLAEFLEECFDIAELSGHNQGNFRRQVDRELAQRGLTALRPRFSGLAIDLLNLRAEICGVLDLTEQPDLVDAFTTSWEYSHNEPLRRVSLARGSAAASRHEFVQSGLGALHLAAQLLTQPAGSRTGSSDGGR